MSSSKIEDVQRLTEDWQADHEKAINSMERSLSKLQSLGATGRKPPKRPGSGAENRLQSVNAAAASTSLSECLSAERGPASDPGCSSSLGTPSDEDPSISIKHMADVAVESWRRTRVLMTHLMVHRLRNALDGDDNAVAGALVASGANEDAGLASQCLSVDALDKQTSEVKRALHDLDDLGGFDCARDSNGLVVHYRNIAGTQVHSIRFQTTLDFATEECMSLAREFDLLSTWNKFCTISTVMKDSAPSDVWVYCGIWLPYPFSERDVVLHCRGHDLLEEEGCYLVTLCSEEMPDDVARNLPTCSTKRERVSILQGSSVRMVPLPPSTPGAPQGCRATMMMHSDPHIPRVPKVLVNFVLNVLAPVVYSQVVALMAKVFRQKPGAAPSLFQRRMEARPELYGVIRERCAEAIDGRLTRDEDPESQRMRRDSSCNFPDAAPL